MSPWSYAPKSTILGEALRRAFSGNSAIERLRIGLYVEHELVRCVVSERKSGYAPLAGLPAGNFAEVAAFIGI